MKLKYEARRNIAKLTPNLKRNIARGIATLSLFSVMLTVARLDIDNTKGISKVFASQDSTYYTDIEITPEVPSINLEVLSLELELPLMHEDYFGTDLPVMDNDPAPTLTFELPEDIPLSTYSSRFTFSDAFTQAEIDTNLRLIEEIETLSEGVSTYIDNLPLFIMAMSTVEMTPQNENVFIGGLPSRYIGGDFMKATFGTGTYTPGPLQMCPSHAKYPIAPERLGKYTGAPGNRGNLPDAFNYYIGWLGLHVNEQLDITYRTRDLIASYNEYSRMALFAMEHNNSLAFLTGGTMSQSASAWFPNNLTRGDAFAFARALGTDRVISALREHIVSTERTSLGHTNKSEMINIAIEAASWSWSGTPEGWKTISNQRNHVKIAYPILVLSSYLTIEARLNGSH